MNHLTKYLSPLLFSLAFIASHQALSETIQFENVAPVGSWTYLSRTYTEGDYSIFSSMVRPISVSSSFPSTGSYGAGGGSDFVSLDDGPVVTITRKDGLSFALNSLDLAVSTTSATGTLHIWGQKSDQSLFDNYVDVSGNFWQTATFTDDPTFSDLLNFRISYIVLGTGRVGIDNINVSQVPIPAAAWLLGSGLIGLMGVARRRLV